MHSIVVFYFISVDGSFQEEATEENNEKSRKKAGPQLGVTWRYVLRSWSLVLMVPHGTWNVPLHPLKKTPYNFQKYSWFSVCDRNIPIGVHTCLDLFS